MDVFMGDKTSVFDSKDKTGGLHRIVRDFR